MLPKCSNRCVLGQLIHAGSISGLRTDAPVHPGALERAKDGIVQTPKVSRRLTLAFTRPEFEAAIELFVKVARVPVSGHAIKLVAAIHRRIASRSPHAEARRVVSASWSGG